MTVRSFSLGRRGEAQWEHLRAAYVLSRRRGEIILVTSDSRDVRDEVRRRLESLAPRVELIEPGKGVTMAVHACAKATKPGEKIPVAWIEAPASSPSPDEDLKWIEALVVLNQTRDALQMHGPCHVVLAGPRALQRVAALRAPDLTSFMGVTLLLDDTLENLVTQQGTLTWMHLSDLHVQSESWQQDHVLDALVRDIPKLLDERELRPELLFVSGDVAARGQRAEYDGAFIVLDEVARRLDLERRQQVFVVPGNHDVDRGKIGRLAKRDHASLLELEPDELRDAVGELLGDAKEFMLYGERLEEWCSFTEKLLGRARSVSVERPWRSDVVDVGGLSVGVLSLCTAWTSGPEDRKGSLLLGERQIHEMVAEARDGGAQLMIALMHHPLHWLHDGEYSAIRSRIERDVDVVLHGHVHDAHSALYVAAGSAHVELGAGAVYGGLGRDPYHGFSVGCLDLAQGRLDVHGFTWSTRSGKWHADSGAPGADERGRVSLRFSPAGIASGQPPVGGHEVLATRLRHAAAKVYATVDFAGLGAGGPRKHVTLEQIFVPLQFQSEAMGGIDMGDDWDGSENADQMFPGRGEKDLDWLVMLLTDGRHCVVLGDPGSGKSTLCKHVAVEAALREDGPVPILLTVRDWLAEGRREGLLEMAAREATQRLAVSTDSNALQRLCEHKEVWFLIDGIDEAADPNVRRELRDRVHGLASSLPNVTVMATSRFAGYRDIPLDDRFNELAILPFDDDALEQFVRRWYDLVEDDPTVRVRKRVDLLHALDVEPRAKELARKPLLATLIGMVHFSHAQLPGDRAKLYGLMVELLLITWPAERKRELPELHGAEQQPMLEKLALRLQEQRASAKQREDQAEVLVDLEQLHSMLEELLAEHHRDRVRTTAERRHLARRWSKWLVDACGLLQEQQPGRVSFLHLSLMEYMAGRALFDRAVGSGYEAVAEQVHERYWHTMWRETLLLMLGSENKKRELGHAVAQRLLIVEPGSLYRWEACVFGLALLREEVDIGEFREPLLERTCEAALQDLPWRWDEASKLLADVVRFGRAHGEATRQWFRTEAEAGLGDCWVGAVVLAWKTFDHEVDTWLEARDQPSTVFALLDVGRQHPAGRWARERCSRDTVLAWARTTPIEGIVKRSFEGLGGGPGAIWIPALLARSVWMGRVVRDRRSTIPGMMKWISRDEVIGKGHLIPALDAQSCNGSSPVIFARKFARWFATDFMESVAREISREFENEYALDFVLGFHRSRAARFMRSSAAELLTKEFAKEFAASFASFFVVDFEESIAPTLLIQSARSNPVCSSSSRTTVQTAKSPEEVRSIVSKIMMSFIVDAHAALLLAHSSGDVDVLKVLVSAHLHNRWLNLFFTPLVDYATKSRPLPEHPDLHALLLTYGLIQYQTTWEWPDCPHWRSWFASDPPTHWLPAHVWHLVRSIQDPSNPTHRALANAALDRNDWPELAQALRETTLVPTPPEVLALFDHGDDERPSSSE